MYISSIVPLQCCWCLNLLLLAWLLDISMKVLDIELSIGYRGIIQCFIVPVSIMILNLVHVSRSNNCSYFLSPWFTIFFKNFYEHGLLVSCPLWNISLSLPNCLTYTYVIFLHILHITQSNLRMRCDLLISLRRYDFRNFLPFPPISFYSIYECKILVKSPGIDLVEPSA